MEGNKLLYSYEEKEAAERFKHPQLSDEEKLKIEIEIQKLKAEKQRRKQMK